MLWAKEKNPIYSVYMDCCCCCICVCVRACVRACVRTYVRARALSFELFCVIRMLKQSLTYRMFSIVLLCSPLLNEFPYGDNNITRHCIALQSIIIHSVLCRVMQSNLSMLEANKRLNILWHFISLWAYTPREGKVECHRSRDLTFISPSWS